MTRAPSTTAPSPSDNYDLVPYPRLSHVNTQPDKAATLARLLGLATPAVEQCRVLEVGCATGANLVPLAQAFPGSEFVGIDRSARQIAMGQADIDELGLRNITLRQIDLLDPSTDLGQFGYVIAHGIYSWVPLAARDRLLALCRASLVANGVAYVSYNVYPGWHAIEAIRRMMLYHVRREQDPAKRAKEARGLLEFLAGAADTTDHYGAMLASHLRMLKEKVGGTASRLDAYLLHDHLEEVNEPVHFYQFAQHAGRHGLEYLCDAAFGTGFYVSFPPVTREALRRMSRSVLDLEQYMDFVRNRMFRQTLLVHAGQPINRHLDVERLKDLWVSSAAVPESAKPQLRTDTVEKFKGRDGADLVISDPLSKAAMLCLIRRWPEHVPFAALVGEARAALGNPEESAQGGRFRGDATPSEQVAVMSGNLLQAYTYTDSLVEFHSCAPRFTTEVGMRPVASPWARLQARGGPEVTSLRHERITLDPPQFRLLPLLDGTRDRAALLTTLEQPAAEGGALDAALEGLARAALLV